MIKYGSTSQLKIAQLHPALQRLLKKYAEFAPKELDLSITVGHRNEEDQNKAFNSGKSKKQWPESKHNANPSLAFDFIPYPFVNKDWKDELRFARIAGALNIIASMIDVKIRWGGDWDMDGKSNDQKFMDLGHIELCD